MEGSLSYHRKGRQSVPLCCTGLCADMTLQMGLGTRAAPDMSRVHSVGILSLP